MRPLSYRVLLIACTLLLVLSNKASADTNPPLNTLAQTLDTALANNPELSIMQARIEQADAQLGQALAIFYPQIKTSLSYQYTNNPAQAFAMLIAQRHLNMAGTDFNHPGFIEDYRPQVTASYSLFRGGQDYYQSQAAQLGIETSELEKSATRNRLLSNVTAAFYGELAAIDSHKMSLRTIEAVQSELEQSRARFNVGALLKSDVLSLEVQLAEAQEADIQAANAIEIAHNMLKTLLGLSVTDAYAINVTLESQLPKAPEGFSELLAKALSSHPELKAAEKRVLIAEKQVSAAKGAHLPDRKSVV